jgi:hypothetical protein
LVESPNDMLTPEDAVKGNVRCICLVCDDDIIEGLQRLKEKLGFPMGRILSECLRPFVNTFVPVADLQEQGKLSSDVLPELEKGIESMVIRADIAKARYDKDLKESKKQE